MEYNYSSLQSRADIDYTPILYKSSNQHSWNLSDKWSWFWHLKNLGLWSSSTCINIINHQCIYRLNGTLIQCMEVDGTMDPTLKLFSTTINVRRDQFARLITINYLGDTSKLFNISIFMMFNLTPGLFQP